MFLLLITGELGDAVDCCYRVYYIMVTYSVPSANYR